ncbi:MAG: PEGA domain-containing protein [Deltaproteobacteria bacterium]|nr:MAG: PEGA domain-containing protein [Deltaproteobacteria bacterium]
MKKPIPFGKYYLLERINVGGMAEVFRAKAYGVEGFERLVAVKRILPNIAEDREFITMFVDEAKIAVQLNHANIAQIFDLGVVDGSYYIALEHVHGRDLRAIFDRCRQANEPMPIAQACFIIMKVCEGLDYAHNKRDQSGRELHLVHRDVSPQNILVSFEGEVKLIDFGIAKAAGKGSKTQAGILKGKFGYMSPEQVRGLPIDRRSDIFSCGIVLYELLTGERLFVGESDFSTLEKVRNVEILPPSTYNRKIPDELERIVLKALAKDVDDRYQNAIDLHDELQAFVYTAGEFYSRKDLAAWMKRTFAKEIEEETAKLERFRQIAPPPPATAARGGRRATLAMSAAAPAKPPPPPTNGRSARPADANLEWDDDELETQIYDTPSEGAPAAPAAAAPPRKPAAPTLLGAGALTAPAPAEEPDLSSLVRSSSAWEAQSAPAPDASSRLPAQPAPRANGSNTTPSPFGGEEAAPAAPAAEEPSAVVRLLQQSQQLAAAPAPVVDPDAIPPAAPARSRAGLYVAVGAALVALIAGGIGLGVYLHGRDDGATPAGAAAASPPAAPAASDTAAAGVQPPAPVVAAPDPATGFDIIVDPVGARIKFDGQDYGPAPRRIRNVVPGPHVIEIEAPGFFAKREDVVARPGQADVLRIALDPIDIVGRFTSEPPGATVTLVSEGRRIALGPAPAEAKLDPRKKYEVIFKKRGYVTVSKPVPITGDAQVVVAVVLERADGVVATGPRGRRDDRGAAGEADRPPRGSDRLLDTPPNAAGGGSRGGATPPKRDATQQPAPDRDEPKDERPQGWATLLLGSKPPCKIYIDGKDTGKMTPQRGLKVRAGAHKITLVNNEFKIKKTIRVNLEPGETKRIIEDFSDRLK